MNVFIFIAEPKLDTIKTTQFLPIAFPLSVVFPKFATHCHHTPSMQLQLISEHKKHYLPLLLMGDEQESMIDRYLDSGELFLLHDSGIKAVAVVTNEGGGVCEVKNLAVVPEARRKGYGRKMLDLLANRYATRFKTMQLGTGETPGTLAFYHHCGFRHSHLIPGFFTRHYDHPIVEEGILLRDMIYLVRELQNHPPSTP